LLERHHQLDVVEGVRAQIVDEARLVGDLFRLDVQMLDDDLLHAFQDFGGVGHRYPRSGLKFGDGAPGIVCATQGLRPWKNPRLAWDSRAVSILCKRWPARPAA